MDHQLIITKLEANIPVFLALLSDISADEYTWRIAPEKWNLLEIASHLRDEERDDFRARLKSTLEDPKKEFTPIDPAGWVKERNYASNDHQQTVFEFLAERRTSVKWLKKLEAPDWKNSFEHKKFGAMTAEMFLSEWFSHDLLHLRQIIATRYHYHRIKSGDQLAYAGNW